MTNIQDLLLHRRPFLFVDQIEKADKKGTIATYTYQEDEFFFPGHFPEFPVVPGVIVLESMVQAGGAGAIQAGLAQAGSLVLLATIESVKYRNMVLPGQTVRFEIQNIRVSDLVLRQKGHIYVLGTDGEADKVACEATWTCVSKGKIEQKT